MSRLIVILSTAAACAGGLLLPVGAQRASATVIQPTSVSGPAAAAPFNIDNTRDGSNLNVAGDVLTWTHTSSTGTGDNGAWLASLGSASATYTLPSPSNVDRLYLWQYTDTTSSTFNPWGTESFDIAFSTDGGSTYSTPIASGLFTQGQQLATEPTQVKTFAVQTGVTHVRLTNFTNFTSGGNVGFGEIRFGTVVPEPGSFVLLGFGLVAAGAFRRCRRCS